MIDIHPNSPNAGYTTYHLQWSKNKVKFDYRTTLKRFENQELM